MKRKMILKVKGVIQGEEKEYTFQFKEDTKFLEEWKSAGLEIELAPRKPRTKKEEKCIS